MLEDKSPHSGIALFFVQPPAFQRLWRICHHSKDGGEWGAFRELHHMFTAQEGSVGTDGGGILPALNKRSRFRAQGNELNWFCNEEMA